MEDFQVRKKRKVYKEEEEAPAVPNVNNICDNYST